jgi:hypothetical protein
MGDMRKEKLKNAVRYFYDLQALRIQSGARASKKAELAQAHLDEEDKEFLKRTGKSLNALERDSTRSSSKTCAASARPCPAS